MKIVLSCFISLIISNNLVAQEDYEDITNRNAIGIEQDVLPYILKGYFVSAWYGHNNWRIRGSYAHSSVPNFSDNDIQSEQVNAAGLSIEFFRNQEFKGWWFGPGIGFWQNTITLNSGSSFLNKSLVLTAGGGYNWVFWKGFYLSPWLALHFRTTGVKQINVGNESYKAWPVTPEVSLKVGYRFLIKKSR